VARVKPVAVAVAVAGVVVAVVKGAKRPLASWRQTVLSRLLLRLPKR
jgi:hypothetical protein